MAPGSVTQRGSSKPSRSPWLALAQLGMVRVCRDESRPCRPLGQRRLRMRTQAVPRMSGLQDLIKALLPIAARELSACDFARVAAGQGQVLPGLVMEIFAGHSLNLRRKAHGGAGSLAQIKLAPVNPGLWRSVHHSSKRSRFMTLVQAATKSCTSLDWPSRWA